MKRHERYENLPEPGQSNKQEPVVSVRNTPSSLHPDKKTVTMDFTRQKPRHLSDYE